MLEGGGNMPVPVPSPAVGAAQISAAIPPLGSILINMAKSSPPFRGAGDEGMAPVLKFNQYGDFAGLLYHSPHSVVYEEALPDLAEQVRRCEHVRMSLLQRAAGRVHATRLGNVALATMDEVLYLKFQQHVDLRTLLLNTIPADLVYVQSDDPFWGDAAAEYMWVAHTQWYHRPLSSHEPPDYPSTLSLPEEEQHGDPSRPPNPIKQHTHHKFRLPILRTSSDQLHP
ncbi:hypothetical protein BJV77DRAFT_1071120 [Russula vinacea]|nr:hypothetical protein BJV77DRAFT_1071120 [Russula vinacea]